MNNDEDIESATKGIKCQRRDREKGKEQRYKRIKYEANKQGNKYQSGESSENTDNEDKQAWMYR